MEKEFFLKWCLAYDCKDNPPYCSREDVESAIKHDLYILEGGAINICIDEGITDENRFRDQVKLLIRAKIGMNSKVMRYYIRNTNC